MWNRYYNCISLKFCVLILCSYTSKVVTIRYCQLTCNPSIPTSTTTVVLISECIPPPPGLHLPSTQPKETQGNTNRCESKGLIHVTYTVHMLLMFTGLVLGYSMSLLQYYYILDDTKSCDLFVAWFFVPQGNLTQFYTNLHYNVIMHLFAK